MNNPYLLAVKAAIQSAIDDGILHPNKVLTGFSGNKLIGTLQRLAMLVEQNGHHYLEVGVFQGLSLLSVANAVKLEVFGIDNFAYFDPDQKNLSIVQNRQQALNLNHASLINADYEDALLNLSDYIGDKKIGVFFVDGPHDYRSQLLCLLLIRPYLAHQAIIVIDDCNYAHVRQANQDFLKAFPEFKLFFQSYTPAHPDNLRGSDRNKVEAGWWNGVNILVHDPQSLLPFLELPTPRSRTVFENEAVVHPARIPLAAPWGVKLADAYYRRNVWDITKYNLKIAKRFAFQRHLNTNQYKLMNTNSADLPQEAFSF